MLREYLENNLKHLDEKRKELLAEIKDAQQKEENLRHTIEERQENINIEYEIFSPRTSQGSTKENLNLMYYQIEEIEKQRNILFEKLDQISAEWNCFKSMLSELNQLENGDKK